MIGRTHLLGRSAFLLLGWTGFGLAVALVTALCAVTGRSVTVQLAIAAAAVLVYVGVAVATRQVLGRAALIYYHHVLAFLVASAALAWVLGAPVLAHLDVTACGLSLFTAVARTGCLLTGCCHGRPTARGVVYGPEHVRLGLPAYLVGLRLAPLQAVEAAACGALAVAGSAAVLAGAAPGTAFVLFVSGYALTRFPLEWLRGDLRRPVRRGLSEAQWISLTLATGAAVAGLAGGLPGAAPAVIVAALLAAGAVVTWTGRAPGSAALLAPRHVAEIAARLERAGDGIQTTRLGLRISGGRAGERLHYTLSAAALSPDDARRLAGVVQWTRGPDARAEVVRGQAGAVHVLVNHRPADA